MTARRSRRRRAGLIGVLTGVAALALVALLGVLGTQSLLDSSSGQTAQAGAVTPVQQFPYTPTGLIGVTDDDGVLASAAVFAVAPDGTGGTIVSIAGSADSGSGTTGELRPLNAELATGGPEAFGEAAERLTGLSFDVVELVDVDRLEELLAPLGDLTPDLVSSVTDASTGERWTPDSTTLAPDEAARLLAARAAGNPDWYFEPNRSAVWTAVADRVGAGIGSADPVASSVSVPSPGSMDLLVDRLFADRVDHRPLTFTPIPEERRNAELSSELADAMAEFDGEAVEVVAHDRGETQFVLASVASARLGAPLLSASIRIEVGLSDEAIGAAGTTRADVGAQAVSLALSAGLNVISVIDDPALGADEPTRVAIAEPDALEDAWNIFPDLYGDVEIDLAGVRIGGIDAVVRLGESWLNDPTGTDERSDPDADDEAADATDSGPTDDDPTDDAESAGPSTTTTTTTQPDTDVQQQRQAAQLEADLNSTVAASPIRFEPGASTLAPSAELILDRLAVLLTGVEGVTVVIEGHTDSDGADSGNLAISQARAEAVVAALVERGVDPELLTSEGLGSSEPIVIGGVEDKPASRRVEFRVEAVS